MLMRDDVGQLLTFQEVMATLRVGRATVSQLVSKGDLELVKVSPLKSRITERSLKKFLLEIAERTAFFREPQP
jgi:DNA-binding TFAR19-related protein (PDSD5 family)